MTKLKPLKSCPFCGNEKELEPENIFDSSGRTYESAIRCRNCGCLGPPTEFLSDTEEEWNKRAKVKGGK